jgi:hypothetical protein
MKLTCPFCKVEYAVPAACGRRVECVICGHIWVVRRPARRGLALWLASGVMILAAAMFVIVAAIKYLPTNRTTEPLIIEAVSVSQDKKGWAVSGRINNASGKIYGIPDLVVQVKDNKGTIIQRNRFMPPAPLIYIDEKIEFKFNIAHMPPGTGKVAVEFVK